jgi:hypothetical protein
MASFSIDGCNTNIHIDLVTLTSTVPFSRAIIDEAGIQEQRPQYNG